MVSARRKSSSPKRFIHTTGQQLADQYYNIYNFRLASAREALKKAAQFRWGDEVKNVPLEQLNASLGSSQVYVIGTLFKLMPKQPSILREIEGNEKASTDPDVNFTSEEDSLILHETDENVQVVGDVDVHLHVTGIPVALLGHQLNGGAKFHVTDICYAGPSLDVYKASPNTNGINFKNEKLLIISGLEFGFEQNASKDQISKVIDGLKNLRELVHDQQKDSSKIVKIIIAGNSVAPGFNKSKVDLFGGSETKDTKTMYEIFCTFDKYLHDLAQSGAEIALMPGKNDPTSILLPQQPFHPKILPKSGILENVTPVTNPCFLEYKSYTILGTSGENIEAIRQHSRIEPSARVIKHTLEWGHLAPSAPDNLSCLPFKDRDPFIIDTVPDIYFAGNQPEYIATTFKTESKPKVQLIAVPSFVKSLSGVLVDLSNLECELISFE